MRIARLAVAALFNICLCARAATGVDIAQQSAIEFPGIGSLQVSVLEPLNDQPQIVFERSTTGELITAIRLGKSDPLLFKRHSNDGGNPHLRFKVLTGKGLPSPLILAVAIGLGGSDCLFESSIIGGVDGKIAVLTPDPLLNSVQGGVYVGDLGKGRGVRAAVWSFLWEKGE